jgi:hypothetical protein
VSTYVQRNAITLLFIQHTSCHQAAFRSITSHGSGSVRLPSAVDRSCHVRRGTSCSWNQAASLSLLMTTSPSLPYIITNRLPRNHHAFCAPSAAIMTSLTPQEARVVHKLNLFASVCPQCLFVKDPHKLIRQLYHFNYFYPSQEKAREISQRLGLVLRRARGHCPNNRQKLTRMVHPPRCTEGSRGTTAH